MGSKECTLTQDELTESVYIRNIINGKTFNSRINLLSFQSTRLLEYE